MAVLYRWFYAGLILFCSATATQAQERISTAADNPEFAAWLAEFETEALEQGVGQATLDRILPGIQLIERVIRQDQNQPEFKETYAQYLEKRVTAWRRDKGRAIMRERGAEIEAITRQYDVQARFVLAILGLELNYGTYALSHSAFDVLATLAYDARRAARFRRELLAALQMVDAGYAGEEQMKSSWAGALGQPQFTPVSYLEYAVDHDGDGKRDIWSDGPDVYASVANYLQRSQWDASQTWGRAVQLPPGGEQRLAAPQEAGHAPDATCTRYTTMGAWRSLAEWQALGVRRADGSDLPAQPLLAALILGDEGDDRGYLVYRNFCSLLRYNPAFKYALSVGLLADVLGSTTEATQ